MTDRRSTSTGAHVDSPLVEAIARRVAELLRGALVPASRLLTPSEVAEGFAVSRTWVYEHAELGAIRLGQVTCMTSTIAI
jgi:hypothetical protein